VTLAVLSDVLVVLGLVVMTVGVYGLYRMPDVYTQLHASSKAVFLGVIALLAASVATRDGATVARAALTAVFLTLTTPVAGHIVARAAYRTRQRLQTPGAVDESGSSLARGSRRSEGLEERGLR
jgi:multicomponent Na+:H+ antiporter subunit G